MEVHTLAETEGGEPGTYRLHGRFAPGERLDSPLLPGFSPDVGEIFAPGP